jgi:hypothetical protein
MRRPAAASIASRDKASKDAVFPRAPAAILQPLLGGHADLGSGPSEIIPKASIERPGASKGLQSPSENFSPFPGIEDYQWLTGELRQKKLPTAPVGRTGVARRRGERSLTCEKAFGARQAGRLPIPPSSIPILLCRRLIDIEAGLRRRRDARCVENI